jgi:hypothetical protein
LVAICFKYNSLRAGSILSCGLEFNLNQCNSQCPWQRMRSQWELCSIDRKKFSLRRNTS